MDITINILIIDDHTLYLEGIKALLSQCQPSWVVTTSKNIRNQRQEYEGIDIILLDLRMPHGGASSVLNFLKANQIPIPVLIVSASEHSSDIQQMLSMGALGYIPKTSEIEELSTAIKSILAGDIYLPAHWAEHFSSSPETITLKNGSEYIQLSPRLYEVLQLVDKGYSNKEISTLLGLSIHTVNGYVKNLFQRISVNSRTELIHTAKSLNLFQFNR